MSSPYHFLKVAGAFRWHFAHPSQRKSSHQGYRTFICGWKFHSYNVSDARMFEDITGDICSKCIDGYNLYLIEE